ncbi:hypothetical protein D9758_005384 [Tetrapyrgos nigripes]|uniref:Uncharacterized protein n=1 Tax=Tetrapyrgos nigripes TaxID=182062 RepID=A0A8H5LQ72_9AGAR|nr:hypothetical protein D9758_005384 [Tetrapyrgos nigripes]
MSLGMRSAYINRSTEDPNEDIAAIEAQQEFDLFVSGTDGTSECGLSKLADVLNV